MEPRQDIWHSLDARLRRDHVPVTMLLEITRRCNLRCIHCYNKKNTSCLDLKDIASIARQLRQAGCLFLTLSGGEVLMRADFFDIAGLLRREGFDLKIITNGTLITRRVSEELARLCLSEIGVSLHGASASVHDAITGVPGSFERTFEAIRLLNEQRLPVYLKCTLMKSNIHEYEKIIALAGSLGVHYIVDPIVTAADDGCTDTLKSRLDADQLRCFYRNLFESLEEPPLEREGFPCEAGSVFGAISVTGDVYPCIQIPVPVGNVFSSVFKDIWTNAPLLTTMRSADRGTFTECFQCRLYGECNRCPGLAYLEDGDLFGKSSVACLIAQAYKEFKDGKER